MSIVILCKFRKIDRNLLDSLVRGYIYFSHPEQLNDPFDCKLHIINSLQNAINRAKPESKERLKLLNAGEKILQKLNNDLSNTGIFSCSQSIEGKMSLREPLLWSHYADRHKGVCLIYNIPDKYILENNMGGIPVEYGTNPLQDFFITMVESGQFFDKQEGFIDELAKTYLSVKDKSWSYENEYRLVIKNTGEFQLDKSFLKHVCYGLNTSPKDIDLIDSILEKFDYDIEPLRMERTENDFGIIEKKI